MARWLKNWRRLAVSLLIVMVASAGLASVVRAHAVLLRSVPAADSDMSQPPPAIEMWFTEPLEASFTGARLLASDGTEVETGAAQLDPTDLTHITVPLGQLEPGIYTVAWQTLSQVDGHEWYGSFPFTVLNPDGTRPTGIAAGAGQAGRSELPSPGEVVFRWLALVGGMLLFGAPLFRLLAGSETSRVHAEAALAGRVSRLAATAVWAGAGLLLLGNWGQALVQAMRLGGLGELPGVILDTRTGALTVIRQVPVLAALWIALSLPRSGWVGRFSERGLRVALAVASIALALLAAWATLPDDWGLLAAVVAVVIASYVLSWRERPWVALLLLAAAPLAGYTAISHAAAVPGRAWAILGDYIHLLAAGTWLGGLLLLPWLLFRERSNNTPPHRLALWHLARRYSYLASLSIFVLAVSGLFNSLVELPTLESLWTTVYGRVLLAKLAVLAVAMGLALLNNRLLHGRKQSTLEPVQIRTLMRQAATESAVALGLMITVAVLVQTAAPRSLTPASAYEPQLPFVTTLTVDDLLIHAQVTPNQVGQNRFWLHLYNAAGTSVGEVQLVRLRLAYLDTQLGQASVDLEPLGQATFAAEGAYLSQAGNWAIEVYVRRRGLDDTLTQFSVNVPAATGQVTGSSPWINPVIAIPGMALAAGALLALGLTPLIWRKPLLRVGGRIYTTATLGGFAVLVVAMGLSMAAAPAWRDQILAQQAAVRTNPVADTPESRAQGQTIYTNNCMPCHGPTGRGDGPVGVTLRPAPANLQVHMIPGAHSDAQIFDWVTNGYPNSPMPAFGEILTEDERWNLLNYIRTLTPPVDAVEVPTQTP